MKKHYRIIFLAFIVLAGLPVSVSGQLSVTAEVRPRAEYRNGFKTPLNKGVDPAFFIEQRTRLSTGYSTDNVEVFISFQDVRNWGATAQIYKTDPSLQNVYAAWASYKFNSRHSIAVGRMELDYDNARILGNLDWAAQGRSHDLVKYEFKGNLFTAHTGFAFNQDQQTPEPVKLSGTYYAIPNSYKSLQYAWVHRTWEKSQLSLLFVNNGASSTAVVNGIQRADTAVYFSQTAGLFGTKTWGTVSLEGDGYLQFGKNPAGKSIRSFMAGVNVTFWKPKPNQLTLGVEYLSGDDVSSAGTDEAFNPLYGTHHKFYGFMDYFYVGSGHKNAGLIDGFLRSKIKVGNKSIATAHLHQFFSQASVNGSDLNKLESNLGTELDLVYVLNVTPAVVLHVGYSQMLFTRALESIKGVSDPKTSASWAWTMITFKPALYASPSKTKE